MMQYVLWYFVIVAAVLAFNYGCHMNDPKD